MVYRRARSWYSILLVLKLWTEAHNLYRDQNHPKEKEMQEGRVVVWRGLTNSGGKKRSEKQGRKGKTYPTVCRVPENSKEDKKAFFNEQCKEVEGNNRMGKTRDLLKKIRDSKGTFHAKMGIIKGRNGMDLTEADNIKKRWQEYKEQLYKKCLNDQDNHKGVWSLT